MSKKRFKIEITVEYDKYEYDYRIDKNVFKNGAYKSYYEALDDHQSKTLVWQSSIDDKYELARIVGDMVRQTIISIIINEPEENKNG